MEKLEFYFRGQHNEYKIFTQSIGMLHAYEPIIFVMSQEPSIRLSSGCPLQLEMLENEPFSNFGWKSWKTVGFSSALAGKAEILSWAL